MEDILQSFAAARPVSIELLLCTKGDTLLWSQISFTPVFSEADGLVDNYVSPHHHPHSHAPLHYCTSITPSDLTRRGMFIAWESFHEVPRAVPRRR
jgi:hypothetical protein